MYPVAVSMWPATTRPKTLLVTKILQHPRGRVHVPVLVWSKISPVTKQCNISMWQCLCAGVHAVRKISCDQTVICIHVAVSMWPRGLKYSCEEILCDHEAVAMRLVPMWLIENFRLPKSLIHMAVSTCHCPCGLKTKLSCEKNLFPKMKKKKPAQCRWVRPGAERNLIGNQRERYF